MQLVDDFVASATNALKTTRQQAVETFQESLQVDEADWLRRIQRQLRVMKLDECTEENQLALNCLQSMPISEYVISTETKASTANPEQFPRPLQEFWRDAQVDNQASHNLVPTQFSPAGKAVDSWASPWPLERPGLQTIVGTLFIHNFPVGFLHVKEMKKRTAYDNSASARNDWSYAIDFSLFPPSWIANRIIHLSLDLHSGYNRAPSINLALKQACYNGNPSLIRCLRRGDIPGLQKLFEEGEARPTDIVAPWGDSLLHVYDL